MSRSSQSLNDELAERYANAPVRCGRVNERVENLSDFFAVFDSLFDKSDTYWFRGHGSLSWKLEPSALRYATQSMRDRALALLTDFKRVADLRLPRPPGPDENLKWMQIAQHYGLNTRLLDWTENVAVALYFACLRRGEDGMVFVLKPTELNRTVSKRNPRVLDALVDAHVIEPYLKLDGKSNPRGKPTIAINPIINTERISLQRGVFTLHGSRWFGLDSRQASSLVYVPILCEAKPDLVRQLRAIGIDEMSIFPEVEHVCAQLKRDNGLNR